MVQPVYSEDKSDRSD